MQIDLYKPKSFLYFADQFSKESKVIIIGANDGLSFDDLFEDFNPKLTKGILIEPSSRYFNKLLNNIQDFPNLKAVKVALANE